MTDPENTFARLRLKGGRFEENTGMPVEALVELAAYRDLLLVVAKGLFKQSHPERQRVPRGFADRLQLRLQVVEDGSAMPVLERPALPNQLVAPEDDFTRARDVIEDAVRAVASGGDVPGDFPTDALVLFNRFGQTLRPDEAIELRRANEPSGPDYDAAVRRKLILNQRRTIQTEVDDLAWVTEVDGDRMSCVVRLRTASGTVSAPLDEVTFTSARDVLEPRGEGPAVRIRGVGVQDADGNLLRLDAIHEITVFESAQDFERLDRRLDELELLEAGWLDGEGVSISSTAVASARTTLGQLLLEGGPLPRLFPTEDGGIQAEWSSAEREVSVTFDPGAVPYVIAVDLTSGAHEEPVIGSADLSPVIELLGVEDA